MRSVITCLIFFLFISNTRTFAQSENERYEELLSRYDVALTKKDNMPERYKIIKEFMDRDINFYKANFDQWPRKNHQKYYYVATLLRDSYEPDDILQSVEYYNYYLHNYINQFGTKDINSYESVPLRLELAQLYLTKFLYFCLTHEIAYDPAYAVSESCKSIDDGKDLYRFPRSEMKDRFILDIDSTKIRFFSTAAYKTMIDLNHKKNAQVMNNLGNLYKGYNETKEAKAWYKAAIQFGCEEAKTNLANVNKKTPDNYGTFDYRLVAPYADAVYQTLSPPVRSSTLTEETKKYNEWWEATYGKGGSQNRTPMANYNTAPAKYTPAKPTDAEQHRKNMEQITRETERQVTKGSGN